MKSIIKKPFFILLFVLIAQPTYALNPQPGWYAGLIVGANYAENVAFNYVDRRGQLQPGQLGHDIMASIGGQVGYRWCDNFRLELEGIYNNSPFSYLRLNDVTIHSPDTSTELRLKGQSQSGVGTFNIFYDFFGDYSSNAVPYIGVGIGYAYIVGQIEFYYNDVLLSDQFFDTTGIDIDRPTSRSKSGLAGQAIAGISYYLDDFSYFALDGRYLVSQKQTLVNQQVRRTSNVIDAQYQLWSLNIVFNGAFDCA